MLLEQHVLNQTSYKNTFIPVLAPARVRLLIISHVYLLCLGGNTSGLVERYPHSHIITFTGTITSLDVCSRVASLSTIFKGRERGDVSAKAPARSRVWA